MKIILKWFYEKLKAIFYGSFLPFIFAFENIQVRKTKYYFSLCAIFKNEAPYFREWIEYHRMLGVDQIIYIIISLQTIIWIF